MSRHGNKGLGKTGGQPPRQAIWAAIRAQREFTVRDVRRVTGCADKTTRDYLSSLVAAGCLSAEDGGRARIYRLVDDRGEEAPHVRADGTEIPKLDPARQIWTAMRRLKTFSPLDLAVTASTDALEITEAAARNYCNWLHHAGFIRQTKAPRNGASATYLLVADVGPRAPIVQRTVRVFDPNASAVAFEHVVGANG